MESERWVVLPGVWRALSPFFTVGCAEGVLSTLDPASGSILTITDDCRSEFGFFWTFLEKSWLHVFCPGVSACAEAMCGAYWAWKDLSGQASPRVESVFLRLCCAEYLSICPPVTEHLHSFGAVAVTEDALQ